MNKKELLHEVRMNGLYDGWGVSMGWLFALCDYITTDLDDYPPSVCQFRQSPMGADDESYEYQTLQECKPSLDVCIEVCLLLNRYCDLLKLAGKDY